MDKKPRTLATTGFALWLGLCFLLGTLLGPGGWDDPGGWTRWYFTALASVWMFVWLIDGVRMLRWYRKES